MAFTAVVAFGSLAVGAIASNALAPKPPQMQNPAATAPKADPVADAKKAQGAAEQQKKRTTAASAEGSTILTGAQGLGSVPSDQQQSKNLLGY